MTPVVLVCSLVTVALWAVALAARLVDVGATVVADRMPRWEP